MGNAVVVDASRTVYWRQEPKPGLMHHLVGGNSYCSAICCALQTDCGMKISMSRKAACCDNAPMESFWGLLKNELIHHQCYATRKQAKREITEYIEIFYDRMRRQARLGYLPPAKCTQQYYAKKIVV